MFNCFGETEDHKAEVLDVLFTKEPMEQTETAHAEQIKNNQVNHVRIESNSGGRGFLVIQKELLKNEDIVVLITSRFINRQINNHVFFLIRHL